MMYLTFWGKFRGTHEQEHHLHESPAKHDYPAYCAGYIIGIAGMIGVPAVMGGHHELGAYLAPVFEASHKILGEHELSHSTEWLLMGTSVIVSIFSNGLCLL
jgi:NADH-quinone oxidoreductase subunit L